MASNVLADYIIVTRVPYKSIPFVAIETLHDLLEELDEGATAEELFYLVQTRCLQSEMPERIYADIADVRASCLKDLNAK